MLAGGSPREEECSLGTRREVKKGDECRGKKIRPGGLGGVNKGREEVDQLSSNWSPSDSLICVISSL